MIREKVGRAPYILTTARGNQYTGPPKLSDKFTDDSLSRLYAGGGYGGRWIGGHWVGHPLGIWPWLYTYDTSWEDRNPMLRLFVTLRMWVRRARQRVYNRALIRHYTPTLLGKRQRQ